MGETETVAYQVSSIMAFVGVKGNLEWGTLALEAACSITWVPNLAPRLACLRQVNFKKALLGRFRVKRGSILAGNPAKEICIFQFRQMGGILQERHVVCTSPI